jgi:hypothetical protein
LNLKIVSSVNSEYEKKIYKTINDSPCCKARLLFYYPKKESDDKEKNQDSDDWCGW